jgi:mRNA interferase MazF
MADRGLARRRHRLDGSIQPVKRGEIWFADIGRGGDRPVLVLTRDPVADRIDAVVVAHLTTTIRGLTSELRLGVGDGLKQDCVVSFDNLHTLPRSSFRRRVAMLRPARLDEVCDRLADALGCGDR